MTTPLDTILSGGGEAVPSTEKPATETTTTNTATETPAAEPAETEGNEAGQSTDGQKTVPLAALHAEKQKAKRYTEEVVDLRRSNEALQRQVAEVLQRIPVQQQQEAPDFFTNPEAAVHGYVRPELDAMHAANERARFVNGRLTAVGALGKDAIDQAEQAFDEAVRDGSVTQQQFAWVKSQPNPWVTVHGWHEQQRRLAPDFEAQVRADERAKVLAEHPQGNGQQPATTNGNGAAPVMPSNFATARNVGARSGPPWSGPKPLADIFKR